MKKLHPRAFWMILFTSGLLLFIVWSLAAIVVSTFFLGPLSSQSGESVFSSLPTILWVIVLLLFVWFVVWSYLYYRLYRYELTDNSFRKERGVIWKRYVSIPYDRIQNVDIIRGIWARLLGLSDIQIQTAGMSGKAAIEGRLPGLSKEDAEELREELIRRIDQSKGQGL